MALALADRPTADEAGMIDDFTVHGRHILPDPVSADAAHDLLTQIRRTRQFDHSLFLSEAAFDADPQYTGVNPRPGRNLLDRLQARLGFVEDAPQIVSALSALLGPDYEILNRKIVCGVPASAVPTWLKARIEGAPVNNLGAFVHPDYRDITYFYGIDFHQDLIDYKDRDADFVTLYVYLHEVTVHDAPLFLLEGSHRLGATVFPHDLKRDEQGDWTYADGRGDRIKVQQRVLTGETGFAAIWHACTLHGTQPDAADHERISLRYLFTKRAGTTVGIDRVNASMPKPIRIASTRIDLDADGAAKITQNTINQARD
ncbi:phytanoyl-CoA dioxygenase family protein [Caulobacter sp. S45]|uniref:phytanoyl-CoA dioxygenase family protein n=1 Tax=Caulobacter sp. S45 TaxID=1641861 RepID=UPI0020B11DDA|nr:phytanoyl-CoA dioxygenase family protein [Caulobacter sp. S45]